MLVSIQQEHSTWYWDNWCYLMQAIARIETILENRYKGNHEENIPELPPSGISPPSHLEKLCQILNLSQFERDLLLFCAGMELFSNWSILLAKLNQNSQIDYPTFNIAFNCLPQANWMAITPDSPLRKLQIIEIGSGKSLASSALRIDEKILNYLQGIEQLDYRLQGFLGSSNLLKKHHNLVPSHREIADQILSVFINLSKSNSSLAPMIHLCGGDLMTKRSIAVVASRNLGLNLQMMSATNLPGDTVQLNLIQRLWEREWTLNNTILFLELDNLEGTDSHKDHLISQLIENLNCYLIISSTDRRRARQRPLVVFDIHQPTKDEQRLIWKNALGENSSVLDDNINILVANFNLNLSAIEAAAFKAQSLGEIWENRYKSPGKFQDNLWNICRVQARLNLDDLAQRISSTADWEDLILPEKEHQILQEIATHLHYKMQVYETWGFAAKSKRGLGISALFHGQSGTGKTMAAEVLGNNLNLDVYRIDLSSVVSKYIGETEKNLRRIFDAAEGGGTILLFDEADALFGKRSEVKDSHDRYANMEVSYLLQRMEAYQGLAILTTNLKSSIDQAFLRRLGFVVQFPFPDAAQREEIWKRVFPKNTPTEGLNFKKLSSLNTAGGNIRNIAKNAAFIAAANGESVMMKHILQAAKSEYVKLERPMTDNEVRGWV
ncbi:ATP-binding protein [Anabaena sp. FACHB-1237]|uniref:ATP-binding protein n=1 Tax=Anabaena sp. FACHB-1237 TaxID=2692769 RepID=UPI0016801B11|nr:ATP-binding protein [Anabaena sp. FACHB-1237]MBD2137761.1 ATP-binding protein [Anabaena sp. FACHB-1237]